jgi:NAD-dependent SIR2 family protein deacetylase
VFVQGLQRLLQVRQRRHSPYDADMDPFDPASIYAAAEVIADADALLVAAGAGMGVDSGLPDFRGPEGFWRAYLTLGRRGLQFYEVASPRTFDTDPALAWGFYGHRLSLYRRTVPHAGFGILRGWGERMLYGCGVFTSNVDGQFQRAGFTGANWTAGRRLLSWAANWG